MGWMSLTKSTGRAEAGGNLARYSAAADAAQAAPQRSAGHATWMTPANHRGGDFMDDDEYELRRALIY